LTYYDSSAKIVELAQKYFKQRFNCAETVLRAGIETLHLPVIPQGIATGFGGGMGGKGFTCGALTGGIMVLGLYHNRTDPQDKKNYRQVLLHTRELIKYFEAQFGSSNCIDLTNYDLTDKEQARQFYQDSAKIKKCAYVVQTVAARIPEIISPE